jgi:hypothetical protein
MGLRDDKEAWMPDQGDTSKGWCRDGRTWTEPAHEDGAVLPA